MTTVDKFTQLCDLVREERYLQSTLSLLEWDQQTKLPPAASRYRAEQITYLAGEVHQRQTSPARAELLNDIEQSDVMASGDQDVVATVREIKRQFKKKNKLPQKLVEAIAKECSLGQQIWVDAKEKNDFSAFAPQLTKIFDLKKQEAEAVGYDNEIYDALLDDYEPGAKTVEIAKVLDSLKTDLVPLIREIGESKNLVEPAILHRTFPVAEQESFCRFASEKIGFDYERGRLDVTHHPFCTEMGPDDVRITTRYDESFFNMAFFGTLHEAGHGIYEQGLRGDQYGLAPGQFCSLGIHESQSRLWENQVGRSHSFWQYFLPIAKDHFASLRDVDVNEMHRAVNCVQPSLIRVEADEATYNLHIILRFELEQEILNGDLLIEDLRDAWNSKYEKYLGIRPSSDREGVLQDVHWSAGLIGYFPTYSVGNLYSAQFFDAAENELGDLDSMFSRGEFEPLKEWLNQNIHQKGMCDSSTELGQKVTGTELSHQPLIRQLRKKYQQIYGTSL